MLMGAWMLIHSVARELRKYHHMFGMHLAQLLREIGSGSWKVGHATLFVLFFVTWPGFACSPKGSASD